MRKAVFCGPISCCNATQHAAIRGHYTQRPMQLFEDLCIIAGAIRSLVGLSDGSSELADGVLPRAKCRYRQPSITVSQSRDHTGQSQGELAALGIIQESIGGSERLRYRLVCGSHPSRENYPSFSIVS